MNNSLLAIFGLAFVILTPTSHEISSYFRQFLNEHEKVCRHSRESGAFREKYHYSENSKLQQIKCRKYA